MPNFYTLSKMKEMLSLLQHVELSHISIFQAQTSTGWRMGFKKSCQKLLLSIKNTQWKTYSLHGKVIRIKGSINVLFFQEAIWKVPLCRKNSICNFQVKSFIKFMLLLNVSLDFLWLNLWLSLSLGNKASISC